MATRRKKNFDIFKIELKKDPQRNANKNLIKFDFLRKRDVGKPFWSAANKQKIINTKYVEEHSPKKDLMPTLRRIRLFDHRQTLFKDHFRKSQIFKWGCKLPYRKIDKLYKILVALEHEEDYLLQKVNLQKIHFPENLPLKIVRREIKQAKMLWDYINVIKTYLKELKRSVWNENTIDEVESQFRNFKGELSKLDDVKGCDAFVQLMANLSQVLSCIYTVMELHNPALGDSLWKEMMEAVKVKDQEQENKNNGKDTENASEKNKFESNDEKSKKQQKRKTVKQKK